jgi:hypothetical protein
MITKKTVVTILFLLAFTYCNPSIPSSSDSWIGAIGEVIKNTKQSNTTSVATGVGTGTGTSTGIGTTTPTSTASSACNWDNTNWDSCNWE